MSAVTGRAHKAASPRPWKLVSERDGATGWKGLSIVDAEGLVVANMVGDPFHDSERASARLIVEAVNAHGAQMALPR